LERDHAVEAVSLFGAEQLPVAGLRFLLHDLGQPLQSLDRLVGRGVVRRAEARQTKLAEDRSNRVSYRTQEADDDVYLGLGELKVIGSLGPGGRIVAAYLQLGPREQVHVDLDL